MKKHFLIIANSDKIYILGSWIEYPRLALLLSYSIIIKYSIDSLWSFCYSAMGTRRLLLDYTM